MFHCNDCTYKTKKEITLKKHINTKHNSQKCKVCDIVLKTSMEMLKHVAKEHSRNMKETIKTKEQNQIEEPDQIVSEVESGKFRCSNCKNVVPVEDTFNIHMDDSIKMCQYCTMISQYG